MFCLITASLFLNYILFSICIAPFVQLPTGHHHMFVNVQRLNMLIFGAFCGFQNLKDNFCVT